MVRSLRENDLSKTLRVNSSLDAKSVQSTMRGLMFCLFYLVSSRNAQNILTSEETMYSILGGAVAESF